MYDDDEGNLLCTRPTFCIFNMLPHKSNSPQENMPLYPDTLFRLFVLTPHCCLLSEEAANSNSNVIGLTRTGIKSTKFRTRGEHDNQVHLIETAYTKHCGIKLNLCLHI